MSTNRCASTTAGAGLPVTPATLPTALAADSSTQPAGLSQGVETSARRLRGRVAALAVHAEHEPAGRPVSVAGDGLDRPLVAGSCAGGTERLADGNAEPIIAAYHDFFFSSRRRHTRSTRDWSSDVCSSD